VGPYQLVARVTHLEYHLMVPSTSISTRQTLPYTLVSHAHSVATYVSQ